MKKYIENPKIKGSGIVACIPQTGRCPHNCGECFFQGGRSYLEPLEENLPNIPKPSQVGHRIVRMNDGLDSSVDLETVLRVAKRFNHVFFNTCDPKQLSCFPGPVVLTVNPGCLTDDHAHLMSNDDRATTPNLMFVRVRVNTWNKSLVESVVNHYTQHLFPTVPVVLTFMAYFTSKIPEGHEKHYILRKRTLNEYMAITTQAWREYMRLFEDNLLVSSCGKIEGEKGSTRCRYCGVCLREYFACLEAMERSREQEEEQP